MPSLVWHIIAAITRSLHINHAGFSVVLLRACWMQGAEKCMEDGHATVCTCNEDLCNRAAPPDCRTKLFILLMSSLVTLFINSWFMPFLPSSHNFPRAFVITAKCDNKTQCLKKSWRFQSIFGDLPNKKKVTLRSTASNLSKKTICLACSFQQIHYWSFPALKKLLNVHISPLLSKLCSPIWNAVPF